MFIKLNILTYYFVTLSYSNEFKDPEYTEDSWVNPRNLFQDLAHDSYKNVLLNENEVITLQNNLNECKLDLANCKANHNPSQTELLFFKRFISSLKRQFPLLEFENNDLNGYYTCDINLSHSNYKYLIEFSEQSSSSEKLTILENLLINTKWVENAQVNQIIFSEKNLEVIKIVLMVILSALCFVKVVQSFYLMNLSLYRIMFISLLLMFAISVPWTWSHLYQKAKSKKMAEIYKGIPDSCNVHNNGFWMSFTNLFTFRKDECSKYFENTEVDPFLEITPTMALSVTITRFVLEPAEYIGDAFRRFMVATFQDLPIYLIVPVTILMIIIFMTIAFTLFGYRVRTMLFSIEPSTGRVDYSREIEQLRIQNQQLHNKLLEIESPMTDNKQAIQIGAGESLHTNPETSTN